jgi:acetylornithine deacetylase/succinyl-diaminopimelate desuccinylase-like protein
MKFVIEGEEEIASENLDLFVAAQKELLACDVVLVSDTSMPAKGMPAITYGLRGLVYMQVDLVGANTDLHSGTYGGAVQNPAVALAGILASMKDSRGKVKIAGFYDDVLPLRAAERAELAKVPHNERAYKKELGIAATFGEAGYTTTERATARPTLDVNGIWGGYQGEGSKTVLPAKAGAKVSMRLVPNQKPAKIAALFAKHVKKACPPGVKCEVRTFSGGMPFLTPLTEPALKKAAIALEKGFGAKPVFMREGGSIPVVSTLSTALRAPVLLLGFGLHTEKAHAPNEHFDLDNFRLGTRSIAYLLDELAK